MAQLPCTGSLWPLSKPPFGSCAIYFHHSVGMFIPDIDMKTLKKNNHFNMYLLLNMFIFQPAMLVFWRISFQINSERKRPMIVRVSMHSYSVARGYAFELLILHLVASYSQITPIRTATYQRNELNKWVIQKWINSQQFQRERV